MTEQTLIIIKPDGIQRHLAGQIINRFENKGFKLAAAKFIKINKQLAEELYSIHKDKPFYEGLVRYISSGPVMIMVWQANGVIETARKLLGATFGYDAQPGTIRGDFSCSQGYNIVHGSDSRQAAEREISLFFNKNEIINYNLSDEEWLYGTND